MNKNKLHKRGLTSFFTLFGFLIMGITGLILYIVPQGRIAYWVNWKFLGLTKTDWGNIHILASLLFIVAGAFHTYFNWKPLMNYFRDRISHGLKLKWELFISLALSVLIVFSALFSIPPLAYLLDFNEYVKDRWIVSENYEPPFGHAEELSLEVFAKKMGIDLEKAQTELQTNGIVFNSPKETLLEISEANQISPMALYMLIKKFEKTLSFEQVKNYTPEMVEVEFAGTNLGNKTLEMICENLNIEIEYAQNRLHQNEIEMSKEEKLKNTAERYALNPIDILKAILIEDFKVKQEN